MGKGGLMYIVTMDKQTAKKTYLGKEAYYTLSNAHKLRVKIKSVRLYGGVVLCTIKVLAVLLACDKDQTNYVDLEKDTVLAGKLVLA